MPTGTVTPPEGRSFADPVTGVAIRQLTDHRAHSHHLYFTNSGLWDGGRRMLIASDRGNATNLYSVDLAGGELTQLTDFGPGASPSLQSAYVNPRRDEVYFRLGRQVVALDLRTLAQRVLSEVPAGYIDGNMSCTADGKTLCMAQHQDLSDRIRREPGYIGFGEYSAARPHCRIVAIGVDGGAERVLHEEDFWLAHVNTSPVLPDVLTFCHEGPWRTIDQRMWVLNVATGRVWKLGEQTAGEAVGHEYWFADGRRVGFHGSRGETHLFGWIHWDGTDRREIELPHASFHFHSLDETLIVGDGLKTVPYMLMWRLAGGRYDGPRILLRHRASFHVQIVHVHPRMFRDLDGGLKVVYTADHNGYGNAFVADVPDLDRLPPFKPQ